MKKVILCSLLFVFFGCEKYTESPLLSAKEEFKLLPKAFGVPYDMANQKVNFFRGEVGIWGYTTFLFFKADTSAIQLENVSKVTMVKGLGDICCVCSYGGDDLPGGYWLSIYNKDKRNELRSQNDSLMFSDIKIGDRGKIIIEMFSIYSFLAHLNDHSQFIGRPEDLRKYYGKYSWRTNSLIMD